MLRNSSFRQCFLLRKRCFTSAAENTGGKRKTRSESKNSFRKFTFGPSFFQVWYKIFYKTRVEVSLHAREFAHSLRSIANFPSHVNTHFQPLVCNILLVERKKVTNIRLLHKKRRPKKNGQILFIDD